MLGFQRLGLSAAAALGATPRHLVVPEGYQGWIPCGNPTTVKKPWPTHVTASFQVPSGLCTMGKCPSAHLQLSTRHFLTRASKHSRELHKYKDSAVQQSLHLPRHRSARALRKWLETQCLRPAYSLGDCSQTKQLGRRQPGATLVAP